MSDSILGANAERTRHHNRQMVLGHLRASGGVGRAEIARSSGLSIQAVSNITSDLLSEGLILEQGRKSTARGQPPVLYALNPDGGFALGIEIRPDAVFGAILNICGQAVASERMRLRSPERHAVTEAVVGMRDALLAIAGIDAGRLFGAGIVMPGPFGETGLSGSGSDLPGWEEVTPDAWFAEHLDLPVIVENDANAAAIAERISGVAHDLDAYAFLYFGSGLGLGSVQGGRLVKGAFGNAGEIGHIPVPQAGRPVPLESAVSRLSVQTALRADGIEAVSGDELSALYAKRNDALMAWLSSAAEPLSAAVTILENLLDPETVILGGAMPDPLLDHLIGSVTLADRSVSNRPDRTHPRLMRGASGRMTATLGAAALVVNRVFTPNLAAA